MSGRLHEVCQNPSCPYAGGPRRLDEVRPPLKATANCSTSCGNQVRKARRDGVAEPGAAVRFRQRMAVRTGITIARRRAIETRRAVRA